MTAPVAIRLLPALALCLCLAIPLAAEPARTPAALGVDYTLSAQTDDGFFRYEYDFLTGRWSERDNIVRQAGTAYALGLYHAHTRDPDARAGVLAALDAFSRRSVDHGGGRVLSGDGSLAEGNTGATALALIAALLTEGPQERARGWLRGLLALQRPDGRFARGPLNDEPSAYYDGETWLAFAYAAQSGLLAEDEGGALHAADAAMVATYTEAPDVGFFHWGQLAARLRHESTSDPALVQFSAHQVAQFLGEIRPRVFDDYNECPSVEGLAAAYATLAHDPRLVVLREGVAARIDRVLANADALQIKPGATGIGFREGVFLSLPEIDRFTGAFIFALSRPQARIDTTQHCIAAFLAAEELGLSGWKD